MGLGHMEPERGTAGWQREPCRIWVLQRNGANDPLDLQGAFVPGTLALAAVCIFPGLAR